MLTVEQARKEAQKIIGQIATGINPIAEKQALKINSITLKEVFNDYKQARKSLKYNTLYNYERVLTIAFAGWGSKPLLSITKDKVGKHHEKLGKEIFMKKELKTTNESLHLDQNYKHFLSDIKERLQKAQIRAALAANSELIQFYWELGNDLIEK